MIKASIVTVGNEILSGQTVDTNAAHLSAELLTIGVPVVSSYVVRDEIDAIMRGLGLASSDADIIINLPKLKTHTGFVYTGAIKNLFGLPLYGNYQYIGKKVNLDIVEPQ